MRLSQIILLVLFNVVAIYANVSIKNGNYTASFDHDKCMLQIIHTETGREIFNANPLTMVQTGYGNVDYAPSRIV